MCPLVQSPKEIGCSFCSSDRHFSANCDKLKSVASRRQRVKQLKLCYNCFQTSHGVSSCSNKGNSKRSSKCHHTSICDCSVDKVSRLHTGDRFDLGNGKLATASMTVASSDVTSSNSRKNILPVALLSLKGTSRVGIKAFALFDICSQRTFVLKSLVCALALPIAYKTNVGVDSCASCGAQHQYNVVTYSVQTTEGSVPVACVVVGSLTNKISMSGRSTVVTELKRQVLNLANLTKSTDMYNRVELIIGVGNYFKLVHASKGCDE